MKKKCIPFVIILISILIISGCSNKDKTAKELIDYYNEDWITIQKMKEHEIGLKKYDLSRFEQDNFKKANKYLEDEVLPNMEQILNYVHKIEVYHKEVKELHQLQINAEEFSYQAIQDLSRYYDGKLSEEDIKQKSEELKDKYVAFFDTRNQLMDKYHIILEDFSDTDGHTYQKMKLK